MKDFHYFWYGIRAVGDNYNIHIFSFQLYGIVK